MKQKHPPKRVLRPVMRLALSKLMLVANARGRTHGGDLLRVAMKSIRADKPDVAAAELQEFLKIAPRLRTEHRIIVMAATRILESKSRTAILWGATIWLVTKAVPVVELWKEVVHYLSRLTPNSGFEHRALVSQTREFFQLQ